MDTRRRPGEFELIARYFRPLATASGAFGLADDAALLKLKAGEELVITTDLVAEGIHFLPDDAAGSIAKKALRVNLSDLAAKGATPVGYLLALALPSNWTEAWVKAFAGGLKADQARYGIGLLGGDTSRAASGLTIAITAIGRLPAGTMVHRSGARPGDLIFVSGTIGDAALGLRIRQRALDAAAAGRATKHLLDRYLHPQPRMALAPAIRRHASAALDVSDGLVGDIGHICEESGVGAEVEAAAVPLSRGAAALVRADPACLATALTGGDDYEIVAAIPPSKAAAFQRDAAKAGVPVTCIGRVVKAKGGPVVLGPAGKALTMAHASYDHFA